MNDALQKQLNDSDNKINQILESKKHINPILTGPPSCKMVKQRGRQPIKIHLFETLRLNDFWIRINKIINEILKIIDSTHIDIKKSIVKNQKIADYETAK